MERLAMQHLVMNENNAINKNNLMLNIAEKYLEEGDYQSGVNSLSKVNEDTSNTEIKNLLLGAAEFLNDNYEGSLSFLALVKQNKLDKKRYWQLQLYKLLNYSHLLKHDSTHTILAELYLKSEKDTIGLAKELSFFMPPKLYRLKKASRLSAIIPGSGLFYVGERKHGFASVFVNIAFIGYTAYSIYTKYYITAALTGASQFLRFYNGGKRAAVKIGSKKNRIIYLEHILKMDEYIEKKIFDLSENKP